MHQPKSIRNVLLRGAAAMSIIVVSALPLAAQPHSAPKHRQAIAQGKRSFDKTGTHTVRPTPFTPSLSSGMAYSSHSIRNTGQNGRIEAQRDFFVTPRAFPGRQIDVDAYRRANVQRQHLPHAAIAGKFGLAGKLANWSFLGPNGYSFGAFESNTGRINGMAYDPSNTSTLYVASAKGGVWQSLDGGGSWAPLTDFQPSLATSCVAVDQSNGNNLYVGTGDYDAYIAGAGGLGQEFGGPGFGVLKSTDGGQTWTVTGANVFGSAPIHRITIDPLTPSKLFAAAGPAGLFLSTDSGLTWQMVLGPTATSGAPAVTGSVSNVVYNWTGTLIYAAVDNAGIYFSQDGGYTWATLPGSPSGMGRFDIAPSAIQDAFGERSVYVVSAGAKTVSVGAPGGTPLDPHNALTWTSFGNFPNNTSNNFVTYDPFGGAAFTCFIGCTHQVINFAGDKKVTPPIGASSVDMDVLYVGLGDLWQSQDAGQLWQYASTAGFPAQYGHGLYHCITLNPNDSTHVWVGNEGGLFDLSYVSTVTDPDAPPPPFPGPNDPYTTLAKPYTFPPLGPFGTFTLTPLNSGLGVVQFYNGAYHPTNPQTLLGGTTNNGALFTTTGVDGWAVVDPAFYDKDASPVGIDQNDGNVQYAFGHSGRQQDPVIGAPDYGGLFTTDGWNSSSGVGVYYGDDVEPFLMAGHVNTANPDLFYVATNYLYIFQNVSGSSPTLTKLRQRFSNTGYILSIANAPTNANYLYVGTSDGLLWVSKNGGTTWARIDNQGHSGGLPIRSITGIAVSPLNPLKVFVTVSGTGVSHIWRCDNADTPTWTSVGGESGNAPLPDIFTNCLCILPRNADKEIFVGTDIGVFYTSDGGQTWTDATNPLQLPSADIRDLTYVPQTGFLNTATFGRGFWQLPIPIPVSVGSLLITPNPVVGGYTCSGTVTINGVAPAGGLVVTLTSANPAVASLPTRVIIPGGQTHADFTVTTHYVAKDTPVTLTASANGSSISTVLTVQHPVLTSLTLVPNDVVGGQPSVGYLTLSGPTPTGVTVQLSSTYATVAGVPASVVIAPNRTTARFLVTTKEISQDTQVTIRASANGINLAAKLTVESPKLVSLALAPSTIQSGGISIATVRLDAPALRGGAYVILSSSSGAITIPYVVVIPAGRSAAQFRIHAGTVTANTNVTLTANYNGSTATNTLTVTP